MNIWRISGIEAWLEVRSSLLAGNGGAELLARQWSLPEEKIRTWVTDNTDLKENLHQEY